LIEVRGIAYDYDGVKVLAGIDFTITAGERVALLGANGSGKSTLLRILAGLYFPSRGKYLFEDKEVSKGKIGLEFRRKIGLLFQNPESMIFNPTVRDELAFSLNEFGIPEATRRVEETARRFGLTPLLEKNPLHLSGGEKQKVMLAALLIYEPQLLLLDEPTAAMDPKTSGWLIDLIFDLEQTTVLATHDLSLAYELCDRAIVLDETHRLLYDGSIEALYEDLELLIHANLIHRHRHRHKHFVHSHYHRHFEGENVQHASDNQQPQGGKSV